MRSLLALFLSLTLFSYTFDFQSFAQISTSKRQSASTIAALSASTVRNFPMSEETPRKILIIEQCEADQCTTGGGGAIWIFEGNRGQAVWRYTAAAALTLEDFGDHKIAVHRVDPKGTYSSQWTRGGEFIGEYAGTVEGDEITNGHVWWGSPSNKGTWYGTITEGVCAGSKPCHLTPGQLVELGENSLNAQMFTAAFLCFKSAADKGEYDGEAFAGVMLRDGAPGVRPDPKEALRMLKESAEHGSPAGERGLSQMYETGIGTNKNAEVADLLKHMAIYRERELGAARARDRALAQAQRNIQTGVFIGGLASLLFFGAVLAASDDPSWERAQEGRSATFQACEKGTESACIKLTVPY
jgi:hypothetical protein